MPFIDTLKPLRVVVLLQETSIVGVGNEGLGVGIGFGVGEAVGIVLGIGVGVGVGMTGAKMLILIITLV